MVDKEDRENGKRQELGIFLFLSMIFAPALAVIVVGGYGFLIWMMQLVQGPPAY